MARLQDDTRFPWIVLIPLRARMRDFDELSLTDLHQLDREILAAAAAVRRLAVACGRPAEKLNIASIGNIVPQLHIHIVARRSDDAAWPGPVWGHGAPTPFPAPALQEALKEAATALISAIAAGVP